MNDLNDYLSDCFRDALELVSAWDLEDAELAVTVMLQARLMAGAHLDDTTVVSGPSAYASLSF